MADDDRVEGATVTSLHDDQTRAARRPLLILLAAAALLLLIACMNVATLLLGEATRREIELRTRAALGATRSRLFRQLLTESVILAGVGATAGAALAFSATRLIVRAAPPSIPGLADVAVNLRVLVVALLIAVSTGLLFGLAPALSLTRSSQAGSGDGTRHLARGHARGQRGLIACEVALSMVLLVGAGLLVRSFGNLSSVGFRPGQLLVVSLRLPRPPFADSEYVRALYAALVPRVGAIPGVVRVTATTTPPFVGGSSSGSFVVDGHPVAHGTQGPIAQRRVTTPEFFATAEIPIVEGRAYTDRDRRGTPPVIVVTRALARAEWPDESAIGKRVNFGGEWRTVIGVAGDIATERPSADPPETIYAPLSQMMLRSAPVLLVRTRANGRSAIDNFTVAIGHAVQDVDASVVVSRVDRMDDLVSASLADDRLRTVLIALFATIAAVLAAVGTYGVASTAAERRTREMAIRVAVGASNASVARLVIGGASSGVVLGGVVGVALALVGARALAPYVYGVRLTDPEVYVAVGLLLGLSTVAASWFPARRASRVKVVDILSVD
jgi:predicted permease